MLLNISYFWTVIHSFPKISLNPAVSLLKMIPNYTRTDHDECVMVEDTLHMTHESGKLLTLIVVFFYFFQVLATILLLGIATFTTTCIMKVMRDKGGSQGLRWAGASMLAGPFLEAVTFRIIFTTAKPFHKKLPCPID